MILRKRSKLDDTGPSDHYSASTKRKRAFDNFLLSMRLDGVRLESQPRRRRALKRKDDSSMKSNHIWPLCRQNFSNEPDTLHTKEPRMNGKAKGASWKSSLVRILNLMMIARLRSTIGHRWSHLGKSLLKASRIHIRQEFLAL